MTITATATACTVKTKSSQLSIAIGRDDERSYAINDVVLPGPGEYEVGELFAEVSPALAHFHIEDIVLVVRRDDGSPITSADFEQIERADVLLLVHGGGADTAPLAEALKLSAKIEPKEILIVGASPAELEQVLAGRSSETADTLKVTAKDLPEEGQRIVLLSGK